MTAVDVLLASQISFWQSQKPNDAELLKEWQAHHDFLAMITDEIGRLREQLAALQKQLEEKEAETKAEKTAEEIAKKIPTLREAIKTYWVDNNQSIIGGSLGIFKAGSLAAIGGAVTVSLGLPPHAVAASILGPLTGGAAIKAISSAKAKKKKPEE